MSTLSTEFIRQLNLWRTLVAQDLAVRYRGTLLGRAWPVLLPLLLLALYGFVFGVVFKARWPGLAEGDHLQFALNLYIGLLLHGLLADVLGQAPGLMQRHSNFVRKLVFPLHVLVAVPLGSALVHAGIGLALVLVINAVFGTGWHWTALLLPLVVLPYVGLLYGVALVLSALGVYLRDVGQVASIMVMAILFTSPVFFPREMIPETFAPLVELNPLSWPVTAFRDGLLHGELPGWASGLSYAAVSALVVLIGWRGFAVLRRGFADLL